MYNNGLPNEFTACERYRGRVIATRDGWFHSFKDGKREGFAALSREGVRRQLDRHFPLD